MGNKTSFQSQRFEDEDVDRMACYMETISIIYYSSPKPLVLPHHLEQSTFACSSLPIVGPHVIFPLTDNPQFNPFNSWSPRKVLKCYPLDWIESHTDPGRGSGPPNQFKAWDEPDSTSYLFIPHTHNVSLIDNPDISNILSPSPQNGGTLINTNMGYECEFLSVSLHPSSSIDFPDVYRHYPTRWWSHIDSTRRYGSRYKKEFGTAQAHLACEFIIPKLFPLKIAQSPSEKPDLKSVVNVTLNKIASLDKNLIHLRYSVTKPFDIACVAISIDNCAGIEHIMKPIDDFIIDVANAVRDGVTMNLLGLNIHIFHRGSFPSPDSDSGISELKIVEKLTQIGFSPLQINFHLCPQVKPINPFGEHNMTAKIHHDALWPEIIKVYIRSQSLKFKYHSLTQGKKPIQPWVNYMDYPLLNHLEQVRRSYLIKTHRHFLLQSPLLTRADLIYSHRVVAQALITMGADVSKHRSKKVREWGEKIQRANNEAMMMKEDHPILSQVDPLIALSPFTMNFPTTSISSKCILDGKCIDTDHEVTKSDQKLLLATLEKQEDFENSPQSILKCLLYHAKSTHSEHILENIIVPMADSIDGIELRGYPFRDINSKESTTQEGLSLKENKGQVTFENLHLIIQPEFHFDAFISNRYLLAGTTYQTTNSFPTEETETHARSFFQPLEDLSDINIILKDSKRLYHPSFSTQTHSLFPSMDVSLVGIDYSQIIDQCNSQNKTIIIVDNNKKNKDKDDNNHGTDNYNSQHNYSLNTVYENYTSEQLRLIALKLASPTRSYVKFLYRNDNTLFLSQTLRKLKGLVLVDVDNDVRIQTHQEQCNGPSNLRWFSPLRYLFGVHLFEYSHTCSLPYHPVWNSMVQPQTKDKKELEQINKELQKSLVTLPPSLHKKAQGLLTIPTLRPFFPPLLSQQYGLNGQNSTPIDYDDNSDDDDFYNPEDEEKISATTLLSKPWQNDRMTEPPFEPYQLNSIYHDIDEHHSNGHLGCPIHVVFVIPPTGRSIHKDNDIKDKDKGRNHEHSTTDINNNNNNNNNNNWMNERAKTFRGQSGIDYPESQCRKLNISNITGTQVIFPPPLDNDDDDDGDEKNLNLPKITPNPTHIYSPFEEKLEPYNYHCLTEIFSTNYPSGSPEEKAIMKYRRQLDESCKDELKRYIFHGKLISPTTIDNNYQFHIVTHDQLNYLMIQIQSNAVMRRLKMYAGLFGKR